MARYEGELPSDGKLQSLIGEGQLVITITPEQGERYQGIIALDADTLAGCPSSTLPSPNSWRPSSGSAPATTKARRAAGILLQELPAQSEDHGDDFEHLTQLTSTIKDEELFGLGSGRDPLPSLPP